jgi:hypothetical protein
MSRAWAASVVRDPKAAEHLPPDGREAWRELWAGVRDLRDRTASPTGPPRPAE